MLKRFEVRNYKNFQNSLTIDFDKVGGYHFNSNCLTNGCIGKMIIYGKNATGKTNLGRAIMDIRNNFFMIGSSSSPYLNVDSDEKSALFRYEFEFDNQSVIYEYQKSTEETLIKESLIIDHNNIFSIDFENNAFDITGLNFIQAETLILDRYKQMMNNDSNKGTLPFIRWILSNAALPNDSIILKMNNFIKGMNFSAVGSYIIPSKLFDYSFLDYLDNDEQMKDLTEFLNNMGIPCKLVIIKSPDGSKNLYFDNKQPIPFFENASSGTKALYNLYRRIVILANMSSFFYMDEFDAFYHYEMAENVIRFLMKKYPDCQMIFTTHNTNLMTNKLFRPDCLFILSQSGNLTALCNATQRELREGHNLEKMYISGEFAQYE